VMMGAGGVLAGAHPGLVCVDMSTVSPDASARVAAACEAAQVAFLRAPVSGGPSLAAVGQLGALVSGPPETRDRLQGLLNTLAQNVFYLGEREEARVMKLALNMMIGTTVVGLGEALVLGESWGLDWQRMLDVFTESAVASPFLKYKAPLLSRREFPPAFSTGLLAKDLRLAVDLARQSGSHVAVTDRALEVVEQAIGGGLGEADAVSVVLLLEQLAGSRKGVRP
ncbi:MAG: NAD(P)-dependent oxidoreductase, partial [Candidatus Dormibacteraeota bacterium]|nr:NAD(P)-dependent oxidoreductase [Candidatus Dormibacteraeota bacterium]